MIDHTKVKNAYLGLFRSVCLKKRLHKSSGCNKKVSINKLNDGIMQASREVFQGTVYKDNWKAYHNTLTLMTGKHGLDYMKEKYYFKQMLLLKNGFNIVI